ncbi:phospholipase D-like domain-containing protein [Hydrogenimonas sp.]
MNPFRLEAFSDIVVTIGAELLILLAFLHMLSSRRSPSSMIAWTLAIFLVPYAAVPFYFLFGHRKLVKRYQKLPFQLKPVNDTIPLCNHPLEKLLCANGIPPASSDNRFEILENPEEAYESFLREIGDAKKSIDICVYELVHDPATDPLLEAMKKKAREGVRIRLLLDSIGSARLYLFSRKLDPLREAGVETAFFMPFLHLPPRNFLNLRNHRKIYIFDSQTVLTGGMNLSEAYLSPDPERVRYTDLLCRIEGQATHYYMQIFEMDWSFATDEKIRFPRLSGGRSGSACLQVASSGPDTPSDGVVEALLSAICNATRSITIFTPYFIPNEEFVRALTIALHRGVDLTIVTPEHSDHIISDLGRGSYLRELSSKGAKILLHRGKILHAKAMIFDGECAVIGTINFDNRSLFYNFEVVSFLYSEREIETLVSWGKRLTEHTIPYRAARKPFLANIENFMRMLSPLV